MRSPVKEWFQFWNGEGKFQPDKGLLSHRQMQSKQYEPANCRAYKSLKETTNTYFAIIHAIVTTSMYLSLFSVSAIFWRYRCNDYNHLTSALVFKTEDTNLGFIFCFQALNVYSITISFVDETESTLISTDGLSLQQASTAL